MISLSIAELQKKYLLGIAPEDFFVLLAHATRKEKVFLLAHPEYELTKEEQERILQYLERRLTREPVAYIVGIKEFYGRDFFVTGATLVPRPETELLVEHALDSIKHEERAIDIIDVGTGSGNIIITLAKEIEKAHHISSIRYHAIDISRSALIIARKNAERHDVSDIISFHEGNLLEPITNILGTANNIIITANLPYLSEKIYSESDSDVRDYEPQSALVSEREGLDHYIRLLEVLKRSLHTSSHVTCYFEISPEQTQSITQEIHTLFPKAAILTHQDLSGRDRLIQATFKRLSSD